MNNDQIEAFANYCSFVREMRDYYSWLTDDSDLVNEIARILKRPVSQIDFITRHALKMLREVENK